MSTKTAGRTIGALVLTAFLTYGGGSALAAPEAGAPALPAGVLLIVLNSLVVAAIGVVAFPVLRRHDEVAAHGYLVTRVLESVLLAVGAVGLLLLPSLTEALGTPGAAGATADGLGRLAQDSADAFYTAAMLVLGVGSLLFCRVLLRARLVPRPLAVLGLVGYAVVAVGMALEILGAGLGLVVWVPGGVFEVALGVLLVVRGFPQREVVTDRAPATAAA